MASQESSGKHVDGELNAFCIICAHDISEIFHFKWKLKEHENA